MLLASRPGRVQTRSPCRPTCISPCISAEAAHVEHTTARAARVLIRLPGQLGRSTQSTHTVHGSPAGLRRACHCTGSKPADWGRCHGIPLCRAGCVHCIETSLSSLHNEARIRCQWRGEASGPGCSQRSTFITPPVASSLPTTFAFSQLTISASALLCI